MPTSRWPMSHHSLRKRKLKTGRQISKCTTTSTALSSRRPSRCRARSTVEWLSSASDGRSWQVGAGSRATCVHLFQHRPLYRAGSVGIKSYFSPAEKYSKCAKLEMFAKKRFPSLYSLLTEVNQRRNCQKSCFAYLFPLGCKCEGSWGQCLGKGSRHSELSWVYLQLFQG